MYYLDFGDGRRDDFIEYTKEIADYVEVWRPHNFGDGRSYRQVEGNKKTCGRPFNGPFQIQWDGVVVPCCYDYNNAIVLGNVSSQTVSEVLKGEPYRRLRGAHRSGEFERFPYCNSCDQLCEHKEALVYTTAPKHKNRTKEDIVKSPNTRAEFIMEDK